MKYFIVAGEASGDLLGSHLMKAILQRDPDAEFRYFGGELMQATAPGIVQHIQSMAFMGFVEVIKHLGAIRKLFKVAKCEIHHFDPDRIILIDYPGFNLRLAKWLHGEGRSVLYYVAPQAWAWKPNRVKDIRKYVAKLLVILPFEEAYFRNRGIETQYVGHPLKEKVNAYIDNHPTREVNKPKIAILPGSRLQEIERMLPTMLQATSNFDQDYDLVVAGVSLVDRSVYDRIMQGYPKATLQLDNPSAVIHKASAALVASGTATLETAFHGVPQVVCYKGHPVSVWLGKKIIKLKYISLVNIILDQDLIPERIQEACTPEVLSKDLKTLLCDKILRQKIIEGYQQLSEMFPDEAAYLAAKAVIEPLK